jgi:excinuclease ABC subunit A
MKKIASYSTEITCSECDGYKLQKPFLHVFIKNKHIGELSSLSIHELVEFFKDFPLSVSGEIIAKDILKNIRERLDFLQGVGLGYISLHRKANTLS